MNDAVFHFKQFNVKQDKCAMKVGTDGVLLGAWVQPLHAKTILDIGTGSGLIALMLAQKSSAEIDAIDIDKGAFEQAKENFADSKWNNRLHVYHLPVQEYVLVAETKYDLIVSNPPYFVDASRASTKERNIARHMNESLTFEELINNVNNLLSPKGKFCLILPEKESHLFIEEAEKKKLYCNHITRVRTKSDRDAKRLLMECSLQRTLVNTDEIIIQDDESTFSDQYLDLTKDYYIGLAKVKV